jgi:hypothetical protein
MGLVAQTLLCRMDRTCGLDPYHVALIVRRKTTGSKMTQPGESQQSGPGKNQMPTLKES